MNNIINDEVLEKVSGGKISETASARLSFVGNNLTVSSDVLMKGVHIKINNLGVYSRVRDITTYTYENVRREAPVHYVVSAIYNDNSRREIEFDNPTDPFNTEF